MALILRPFLLVIAVASVSRQTDWSGGPGVFGPVSRFEDTFSTRMHMDYEGSPGELYLSMHGDKFLVTDYMECSVPGVVADINGDGHLDVVCGSQGNRKNRVYWFENDGSGGGWQRHDVSGVGERPPYFVCAVDVDNDGDLDIIAGAGSMYGREIYLWTNTDGSGLNWEKSLISNTWPNWPEKIIPADMDGDGDFDLVVRLGISQVVWYENPMSCHVVPIGGWKSHLIDQDGVNDIFVSDINGDGWPDLVTVRAQTNYQVAWWENVDGTGDNWTRHGITNYIHYGRAVHALDMDGDGDMDVIASGCDRLLWFENNDGLGTSWKEHSLNDPVVLCNVIVGADIYGSGSPVILCAHGSMGTPRRFVLWERMDDGGLTWRRHILERSYWYWGLSVGDIDGDGVLDAVAFEDGSRVFWFSLGYPSTGSLTSSILDVNNYPHWDEIQWQDSVPAGSSLRFRVRSSNDPERMGGWSGYIDEPGSLAGFVDSTHRYFQYRVHMEPSSRFVTPTLYQVLFRWDWLGVEGSSGGPVLYPIESPGFGTAAIRFSLPAACRVSIAVYDLAGRCVAVPLHGMQPSGEHTVETSFLPSGTYFVRMTAGDHVLHGRFVLLSGR